MAAGGVFKVLSGGLGLLRVAFSPLGLAVTAIVAVLAGFKKEGESTFQYLTRLIKGLQSALSPIVSALKWMVKHVGVLGTVLGVGLAAKGGRALLGGLLGRFGGGGGMMGRLGARITGAQPVFVVNWPPGMGMGGMGPMGRAGRMGMMGRALGWIKGGGWAGAAGVGGGIKSMGAAAIAAGFAGLTASVGTWFLGLKKLSDAHSKTAQAELRTKMGRYYKEMMEAETPWETMAKFRKQAQQYGEEYKKFQRYGGLMHPTKYMGETVGAIAAGRAEAPERIHFEEKVIPFLEQMDRLVRAGHVEKAQEAIFQAGISQKDLSFVMKNLTDEFAMKHFITTDMIDRLTDMNRVLEEFKKGERKPVEVTVQLDGKKIAVAVAKIQQTASERGGTVPKAGAKRRALRTGKGKK